MKFFYYGSALILFCFSLSLTTKSHAQTEIASAALTSNPVTPFPSPENSSTEPAKQSPLNFSGYFDTYYFSNLNNPATRSNLGNSGISRGFDRYPGQFQLGMFLTRMTYSHRNTEFVGEVGFGPNVEYGSYGNDFRYKWGTVLANSTYSSILIKQAYITLKANDKLSFTMGQFGTHIGYEMIDAPLNFHYSINNTFNAGIPFYHVGLKGTYVLSDKISLMGGIVNGADNLNDNNRGKSFIGQLMITPAEGWVIYVNTIDGNEGNSRVNGQDTTSFFGVWDVVSSIQISKRLSATVWGMYGSLSGEYQGGAFQEKARHWAGINLYTTFMVTDKLSVGSRLEYFDNRDGARPLLTNGVGTDVKTVTLTANLKLADERLLIKPEFRFDHFRKVKSPAGEQAVQQFADKNGEFKLNTQSTIGLAAIYKF